MAILAQLSENIKNMMRAFFGPPRYLPADPGAWGRPDDASGGSGSGVTAPLRPPPPVLAGRDAKSWPDEQEHLDEAA